jgi:putative DNA primase/helicase
MHNNDFKDLAARLLGQSESLLPNGKRRGHEWVVGSLDGEPGNSLSINITTGAWGDFNAGPHGTDLTALYAEINGISMGEAYKRLNDRFESAPRARVVKQEAKTFIGPPPVNAPVPDMTHENPAYRLTDSWCYRDTDGRVLFYFVRYDAEGERKQFRPFTWNEKCSTWNNRMWPAPRPLYGLELLGAHPGSPALLVEGEKACEAARRFEGMRYLVVTWPGGSNAIHKTDFAPLAGRKVLIWPDADEAGKQAALGIANLIHSQCNEVKILDVEDCEKGFDAADVPGGWGWAEFVEWARPRAKLFSPPGTEAEPEVLPAIQPEEPTPEEERDEPVTQLRYGYEFYAKLGIPCNSNGKPLPIMDTICRAFEGCPEFRNRIWYDDFHNKIFTTWNNQPAHVWQERDELSMLRYLQSEFHFTRITETALRQAIKHVAYADTRHEPLDWVKSLKWDGVPRVETFFVNYFGVPSSAYSLAVGHNFWVSMIARICKPGEKVDHMVILEGSQGIYKSSALQAIGGKWYTVSSESLTSKDFYLGLHGYLLVEIAELDAFQRSESSAVKNVLTKSTDTLRKPYATLPEEFPRQCVFVGTTNEEGYLKDPTGNRRYWPVKVQSVEIQKIREDREQLFAEAYHLYRNGATWWDMPKEETEAEQKDRVQHDAWEDPIRDFLFKREAPATIMEIATGALKKDPGTVCKPTQNRIGRILKELGWYNHVIRDDEKKPRRVWLPPKVSS